MHFLVTLHAFFEIIFAQMINRSINKQRVENAWQIIKRSTYIQEINFERRLRLSEVGLKPIHLFSKPNEDKLVEKLIEKNSCPEGQSRVAKGIQKLEKKSVNKFVAVNIFQMDITEERGEQL